MAVGSSSSDVGLSLLLLLFFCMAAADADACTPEGIFVGPPDLEQVGFGWKGQPLSVRASWRLTEKGRRCAASLRLISHVLSGSDLYARKATETLTPDATSTEVEVTAATHAFWVLAHVRKEPSSSSPSEEENLGSYVASKAAKISVENCNGIKVKHFKNGYLDVHQVSTGRVRVSWENTTQSDQCTDYFFLRYRATERLYTADEYEGFSMALLPSERHWLELDVEVGKDYKFKVGGGALPYSEDQVSACMF